MKKKLLLLYILISLNLGAFAQSVTIKPGKHESSKSGQMIDGKLKMNDQIELEREGVKFADGSRITSNNAFSSSPSKSFLLPIFASFNNPDIDGEATTSGFENTVELHAANFDFQREVDGFVAGQHIKRPFVIKKSLDKASIQLIQAFELNTVIQDITITIRQLNPISFEPESRFTYNIHNARIVDLRHIEKQDYNTGTHIEEEIRLIYNYIDITDLSNGAVFRVNGI